MPCLNPKFIPHPDPTDSPTMLVPCGQCLGCQKERSKQWAMRIMHEAKEWHSKNQSCFITLTYNDEHIPITKYFQTLDKLAIPTFIRSLRKNHPDTTIRYYSCGEYGTKEQRPHYHICLFNYSFPDKKILPITYNIKAQQSLDNGENKILYSSDELSKYWTKGQHSIAELNIKTASYVAQYCMKIVNARYDTIEEQTREPQFSLMSRKPGIGNAYYQKYHEQWYSYDYITVGNAKQKPDRYYDKLYKDTHPEQFEIIKALRKERSQKDLTKIYDFRRNRAKQHYLTLKKTRKTRK